MTNPIRLVDHLLSRARHLLQFGQTGEARRLLGQLLGQAELSVSVRAEAYSLAGELELAALRFRRARRHFAAAVGLRPYEPETYARYAAAVEADPDGEPRRAWVALRKAVDINPLEARYWAALGRAAMRMGGRRKAIRCFRRAARLGPERIEVLAEVVDGFVRLGRWREAAAALNAARFRAPADAAIRLLVNRFRFDMLRRDQQSANRSSAAGLVVLPFPGRPAAPVAPAASPTIVRVDRGSRPVPHVLRMFGAGPGPRQAR